MELLQEVAEIAKAQENLITKEEIKNYLKDMQLEESQYEHIYTYLTQNNIKVQGFIYQSSEPVTTVDENQETNEEDSAYLKMYLEELEFIAPLEQGEEIGLIQKIMDGYEESKIRLMEGKLPNVVGIAHEYKNRGVLIEDLIQEGNLGLIRALDSLAELSKLADGDELITSYVKQSMEQAIDEEMDAADWESTVIAKTALIHEAANYLAEDLGRVASIKELAEYTKLTEEEITDLIKLSHDAVTTAEHEHNHSHSHNHNHNHS